MNAEPYTRDPHILLVEDNPGDVLLIQESFRALKSPFRLSVANDGQEAIDFLYKMGLHTAASRPDLIILDLNLPKINGYDLLAHVKSSADFQSIPVVVLSTSNSASDARKAYSLSANCYLCKPGELTEFFRMMGLIQDFWLRVVAFPKNESAGPLITV